MTFLAESLPHSPIIYARSVVTEVGLAYKTARKMLFQFLLLMNKYLQYTDIPQNTVELLV